MELLFPSSSPAIRPPPRPAIAPLRELRKPARRPWACCELRRTRDPLTSAGHGSTAACELRQPRASCARSAVRELCWSASSAGRERRRALAASEPQPQGQAQAAPPGPIRPSSRRTGLRPSVSSGPDVTPQVFI